MSIEARVMAGIEFLDEHEPGWDERVDTDTLDMSNKLDCVMGQLHGDWDEAVIFYGWRIVTPVRLGFWAMGLDDTETFYEEVTRLWVAEIDRRDNARLLAKISGGQNE